MRLRIIFITIVLCLGLPFMIDAASITNRDNEVYQIKGRKPGAGWIYVEINPKGTKYFECRHGCELVLVKTGSSIQLEKDADVIISNGVLKEK